MFDLIQLVQKYGAGVKFEPSREKAGDQKLIKIELNIGEKVKTWHVTQGTAENSRFICCLLRQMIRDLEVE